MARAVRAGRWARALLSCALLAACSPGSFDELVGGARAREDAGDRSGRDGGGRSPDDASAAQPDAARDAASAAADGASPAEAGATADASAANPGMRDGGSASDGAAGECARAPDPANVRISTADLGVLPVPPFVSSRALTGSTAVGERIAWVFAVPGDRHMVAWSSRAEVLQQPPQLNEQGPFTQLLPPEASPAGGAVGMNSLIGTSEDEALIFYASHTLLVPTAVGLARMQRDEAQASVVRALDLFPKPAPVNGKIPWRPLFGQGALLDQDAAGALLYLYACHANQGDPEETAPGVLAVPCRLARVALADVAHHRAYRHWDGAGWNDDPLSAAPVVRDVTPGITVSFNRYLGAYLMVHSGTNDSVILRAAPRPEGPWRPLGNFATLPGGGPFGFSLGAAEHPALRDECEQLVYVTYTRVLASSDETGMTVTRGETRLVRVRLE